MKRWTYEKVKEYIEEFGHKLLSDEYKNNYTKLLVQCPLGHKYEVTFNSFKDSNSRCPYCSGKVKHSYEYVKDYIESFGYKLLSDEYKNSRTKLLVECPEGHKYEVTFYNFKNSNSRCPECAKYSYEEIKEYIEGFGYKLLSTEYINNKSKLLLQCPNGHKWKTKYNDFQQGHRCSYCNGNPKYTYEEIKEYIESFGYKLLSDEYKNSRTKLLVECPNGHIWETKYNSFQQGSRCPICNVSKGEQRIIDWLNKNNIEYIYEKTFEELLGINNGLLSYDFYLPKYNLLIEYQGNYHDGTAGNQSEKELETQQEHDRRKRLYTRKNNIQLLEIWYWDFENIEKILSDTLEEVQ
jgi:predicted Zn-ribbon and HTH transcriptional regulator